MSTTYYARRKIFARVTTNNEMTKTSISCELDRQAKAPGPRFVLEGSRDLSACASRAWSMRHGNAGWSNYWLQGDLSEERSEDPAVVSSNSIIINHRIIFAATCYADEWTTVLIVSPRRGAG